MSNNKDTLALHAHTMAAITRVTADARRDRKLTRAGYRIVRVQAELVRRELPAAVFAVRRALTEP